jgi:S-(hydroxymethyl)glutathione dehydrogenase/alcohol dehydrogenase
MRAVVIHDYEKGPNVEEVDIVDPRPDEVVVKIAASGVCGSDMHLLHGRSVAANLPMVLGHEGAGVIEWIGPAVTDVAVGDHVVVALYGPCGQCNNCRSADFVNCNGNERIRNIFGTRGDGTSALSQNGTQINPMVGSGTLAEYSVVRSPQVVRIPKEIPLDVICLAGCGVTTGVGAALNTAKVTPGSTVAVVGCGGVGLNVIMASKLAGAARIIAIDTNSTKLDMASNAGATDCVDSSAQPMHDAVMALAPGGVDFAFEVVGNADLVAQTFELTRQGGTCVMVGSPPSGTKIPIDGRSLFSERRLLGTMGGSNVPGRDIPRIVALYQAGKLPIDTLISQRLPLDRVHEAFAAAEAGTVARSVIVMS